jgi:hypothetical protein
VNALASSLDLGEVESSDAPGRRIVIVLDETKVPELGIVRPLCFSWGTVYLA